MSVSKLVSKETKGSQQISPDESDGITSDTLMDGVSNIAPLISHILESSIPEMEPTGSTLVLVKSLIWPLLARSFYKKTTTSRKNFKKMIRATECMLNAVQSFVNLEQDESLEQDYVKYWTDYYMYKAARSTDQPPNKSDERFGKPLFVGIFKLMILRAIARRDITLPYSLQKGSRRLWPALSKLRKQQALQKNEEILTRSRELVDQRVLDKIRDTTQSVLANLIEKKPHGGTKFFPSLSSCAQATFIQGGAQSLYRRLEKRDPTGLGALFDLNNDFESWREEEFTFAETTALARYTVLTPEGTPVCNDVEIIAIPEAGKFRVISKGDGYLYSALQPLQGRMLGAWKHHYASTMMDDDLTDKINKINDLVPEFTKVISGDYKDATNFLNRQSTVEVVKQLLHVDGGHLAGISFLPGRLIYPRGKDKKVYRRFEEGQLMGHPLSFPILCIINLAVYHCAVDLYCDTLHKSDNFRQRLSKAVIVNGDDILFKGDDQLVDLFFKVAREAGFRKSIGKNYISETFCQINSQTFTLKGGKWCRSGYLNLKFANDQSLKGGRSEALPTEFGRDVTKMVQLCPWSWSSIPGIFKRFDKKWNKRAFQPNWYLPVDVGGYGVNLTRPPSFRTTRNQRLVAGIFLAEPQLALYQRLQEGGPTIKLKHLRKIVPGAFANWRIVRGDYVVNQHETIDLEDDWLIRMSLYTRALSVPSQLNKEETLRRVKYYDSLSSILKLAKGRHLRIKVLSSDDIDNLWKIRYVATGVPQCPPLRTMRTKIFNPLSKKFVSPSVHAAVQELTFERLALTRTSLSAEMLDVPFPFNDLALRHHLGEIDIFQYKSHFIKKDTCSSNDVQLLDC